MKKELQDKLYQKYPKIFRQKDLSPQETCMCWGIDCDVGWYWLIDNLCQAIQNHVNGGRYTQVETSQVKQKFGGLRFYIDGGSEKVWGMIRLAEQMSYTICENCGTTDGVTQNKCGWIRSLCKKCREAKCSV